MPSARPLPSWAVPPLTRQQAAEVLGIAPRTLTDKLRKWPYFEKRGNRQVFYPEHIARLREELSCQDSRSTSEAASGTSLEPLLEAAFDKALALATEGQQKNCARSSKRGSGNVIPMAKKRSGPSRKPRSTT